MGNVLTRYTMNALAPFHLAFPVSDLEATRQFYVDTLGCKVGRHAESWIDFDFCGHQITAHLGRASRPIKNEVDSCQIPVPHFGLVLDWESWHEIAERLKSANTPFVVEPYVRFKGKPGEQATLFIKDPSGNAIELKAFKDKKLLFIR